MAPPDTTSTVQNKLRNRHGSESAEPCLRLATEADAVAPFWYALQTRYRFEKKVALQLQQKDIEIFLPLRQELHRWSDRDQEIYVPLFPGYVFVRVENSKEQRLRVLQTGGIYSFVSTAGDPLPIPASQIEHLQLLLSQRVACSLRPFLKIGQRVRIRGGCLHGLEGIFSQDGPRSLVISIESIQRSVAIEIEGYELEPV